MRLHRQTNHQATRLQPKACEFQGARQPENVYTTQHSLTMTLKSRSPAFILYHAGQRATEQLMKAKYIRCLSLPLDHTHSLLLTYLFI